MPLLSIVPLSTDQVTPALYLPCPTTFAVQVVVVPGESDAFAQLAVMLLMRIGTTGAATLTTVIE